MRNFLIVLLSLVSAVSLAQWRLPSRQSTVNTSYWGNLSPTADTVQAVFDYIDLEGVGGSGGSGGYGTNTYVNPSTWQYLLETPTTPTGGVVSGFYLPGTNIVGATYNETNETWTVNQQIDTQEFANLSSAFSVLSTNFSAASNKIPSSANSDSAVYFLNSFSDTVSYTTTNVFLVAPIFSGTADEIASNGDFGSWSSPLERYTFTSPGLYNFSVQAFAFNESSDGNNSTITQTELNNFTLYWFVNGVTNDVKFSKPIINAAIYDPDTDEFRTVFAGDKRTTVSGTSYYSFNVSSGDYFRVMGQSYINGYPTDPRVQIAIPSLFITINRVYVP